MIIKSKKGEGEIQTLMYLFFAVIFIIAGLISVKSYLINVDINKDLQLSNLDFGVIGNRMIASDNCLAEQNTVEIFDGDETYSVSFTQIGTIERSKINPTTIERCLEGFATERYGLSFYDLDETKWEQSQIRQSYGTLNCKPLKRKGEFLINIKETSGQTNLGVFKLCVI